MMKIRTLLSLLSISVVSLYFVSCTKEKTPIVTPVPSDCADTIKFSTQILPMMSDNCFSCHNNGQAPLFNDHASISANADGILKTLKAEGAPLMPLGGPALDDSLIKQFSCWIAQGKANN